MDKDAGDGGEAGVDEAFDSLLGVVELLHLLGSIVSIPIGIIIPLHFLSFVTGISC